MNKFKDEIGKMIDERDHYQDRIIKARADLQNCESKIVDRLIETKQFDLFSVNWKKMVTIAYGKPQRKVRHD